MSDASAPRLSLPEAEAAVHVARAELTETLDALAGRLDPRVRATEAAHAAKQAAQDVQGLFMGKGVPQHDAARTRNLKLLAGAVLGVTALLTIALARRR